MMYVIQFQRGNGDWQHDCSFVNESAAREYMDKMREVHSLSVPHRLLVVIEEFD